MANTSAKSKPFDPVALGLAEPVKALREAARLPQTPTRQGLTPAPGDARADGASHLDDGSRATALAGEGSGEASSLSRHSFLHNLLSSFARGAADDGVGRTVEGGTRVLEHAARSGISPLGDADIQSLEWTIPQKMKDRQVHADPERGYRELADKIAERRAAVREKLPVDEKFQRSFAGRVATGLGAAVPTLGAFAVPGLGPASVAAQTYGAGYDDAKSHGADEKTALESGLMNAPSAAVQTVADKFMIGKILKPLQGKVSVRDVITGVAQSAAYNGASAGGSQAWQNAVAKLKQYDPNRPLTADVVDAATAAATIGGGLTGVAGALSKNVSKEDVFGKAPSLESSTKTFNDGAPTSAPKNEAGAGGSAELPPAKNFLEKLLPDPGAFSWSTRVRQYLFDTFEPLRDTERRLNGGKDSDASVSAWKGSIAATQSKSMLPTVMEHGPLRYNAAQGMFECTTRNAGLAKIFEPLAKTDKLEIWGKYAMGKTALERANRRPGADFESMFGFTREQAQVWVKEGAQHTDVVAASDRYREFNRGMTRLLSDTGLISAEQKSKFDAYLDYVPLYRKMGDEPSPAAAYQQFLAGKAKSTKNKSMPMDKNVQSKMTFTGSKREVNDIFDNIVAQTAFYTDAAVKNQAAQRIVELYKDSGLLTEVEYAAKPETTPMEAHPEMPQLKDVLKNFEVGVLKENNPMTVSVNGERRHFVVNDPALLTAVKGLAPESLNFLQKIFSTTKNVLTRATTVIPPFVLANTARDTASTWVMTGKRSPMAHLKDVAHGFMQALKHDSDPMISMSASGHGGAAYYPMDGQSMRKMLADTRKKNIVLQAPKKMWGAYKQLLHASEQANRIAVRKKILESGGTAAEANFQALDLLNFNMRGSSSAIRTLALITPFFNARLQGLYKLGREFSANKSGVSTRGGLLMAATLAMWAHNRNDRDKNGRLWYRELSQADKLTYYHFRLPESNKIIRIPKPFEFGALFSSIPEMLMESLAGDEKWSRTAAGIGKVFGDIFEFNPANNPLLAIAYEQKANRTMFTGSPIETPDMKHLQPRYRANSGTSATAKLLGAVTNIAPVRIDAATRSLLGGLADYLHAATDTVVEQISHHRGPDRKGIEKNLVIGRFVRDTATQHTRYSGEFFDLKRDVDEAYGTLRELRLAGRFADAENFLKDHAALLSFRTYTQHLSHELGRVRAASEAVRRAPYSAEQRHEALVELAKKRNDLLRLTDALLKKIDAGEIDRAGLDNVVKRVFKSQGAALDPRGTRSPGPNAAAQLRGAQKSRQI